MKETPTLTTKTYIFTRNGVEYMATSTFNGKNWVMMLENKNIAPAYVAEGFLSKTITPWCWFETEGNAWNRMEKVIGRQKFEAI